MAGGCLKSRGGGPKIEGYHSSRFHGLGLPRLLVPDPSSQDPSRISRLRPVWRKLPSLRGKSPRVRGFAAFYQRFFGETASTNWGEADSNAAAR